MGAWGVGIRQDDFVCDVEGSFDDHLKDGKSLSEATAVVREHFAEAIEDSDDGPLFWIALADVQWKYGAIDSEIMNHVIEIIDSELGMERWGKPADKLYQQRVAALIKFREKISTPNPRPSRVPKRVNRKAKFTPGDCLSIQLENGQYGAGLVLAIDESNPEYPSDLVADLNYLSDQPPSIEIFKQRDWLKLTHHTWNGCLNILWYHSVGFKKMKPRLSLIGNIPILESDPRESASSAGWHLLGRQILFQHEWDAQRGT